MNEPSTIIDATDAGLGEPALPDTAMATDTDNGSDADSGAAEIRPAPTMPKSPAVPSFRGSWPGRAWRHLAFTGPGRYQAAFAGLVLAALALRLWELSDRTMHYDEAIHLYYSWRLAQLEGFVHSPWMHGPFQIELVALFLKLFGDSDFAARLAYALFGTALVFLPWFLRPHLGNAGAWLTGLILAVSPSLLYFSRFGRNDIIMAALAATLFILLWRYVHNPRNRYLYLAAAALALAFASKETAYIISFTFGALALGLAISHTAALWRKGRDKQADAVEEGEEAKGNPTGPARRLNAAIIHTRPVTAFVKTTLTNPAGVFLLLLITLTLPQWSAGVDLARTIGIDLATAAFGEGAAKWLGGDLGLNLVGRDGATQGIVGAPEWTAPFVPLPLSGIPGWLSGIFCFLIITGCVAAGWKLSGSRQQRVGAVILPVAIAYAVVLLLARPLGSVGSGLDTFLAAVLMGLCVAAFVYLRLDWRQSPILLFVPALTTLAYCVLFLPVLQVDALLLGILPEGIQVASDGNAVPLNFLVAAGILLAMAALSVVIGVLYGGGVWLACAVIFYAVWITLFTTIFTNPAGVFSGLWQGMGYWIAQQDVARGNQPWYYYFVGMSVYEFLPTIFGLIGAVVFIRRRDRLGMALTFWAGVNLLAYTVASEKMPWLLVNITLPFIFLAGKLLGELVERVSWHRALAGEQRLQSLALLGIPILTIAGGFFVALSFTNSETTFSYLEGSALAAVILMALAAAVLVRRAGASQGSILVTLGAAAFLLGFTVWSAFQAAYTYDDSRREILVYAQGSTDLRETHRELEESIFGGYTSNPISSPVLVDYDAWYPFQWYVRHREREGQLSFTCFRDEDGANGCSAADGAGQSPALLVAAHHRPAKPGALAGYQHSAAQRNLLWFPETYRRPGENRQEEAPWDEVRQDLLFFGEAATTREKWNAVLIYLLNRKLEADWFNSEYYTYLRRNPGGSGPGQ